MKKFVYPSYLVLDEFRMNVFLNKKTKKQKTQSSIFCNQRCPQLTWSSLMLPKHKLSIFNTSVWFFQVKLCQIHIGSILVFPTDIILSLLKEPLFSLLLSIKKKKQLINRKHLLFGIPSRHCSFVKPLKVSFKA